MALQCPDIGSRRLNYTTTSAGLHWLQHTFAKVAAGRVWRRAMLGSTKFDTHLSHWVQLASNPGCS